MGPSGSGKTTILRAIAGLERFDADDRGRGRDAAAGAPRPAPSAQLRRQVGLVFQFHHLFEHLSALQNISLAPVHVLRRAARRRPRRRARELLEALGVEHRAAALPRELRAAKRSASRSRARSPSIRRC